jgi:ATP/maltotriose-dependent transcriptional regulator MalT
VKALELLEKAVAAATRFRSRQIQASWKAYLAEAYLLNGRLEKARSLAREALEISLATAYALGVGTAQRTLGRIAQAAGTPDEAQAYLNQAVETLTTVNARYLIARAHLDLAFLASARGDRKAAASSLRAAHELFGALNAPNLVNRAEQLAAEFGLILSI